MKTDEQLLEENGWIIECESPFEISMKDDRRNAAQNQAAYMIVHLLRLEDENRIIYPNDDDEIDCHDHECDEDEPGDLTNDAPRTGSDFFGFDNDKHKDLPF